MTDLTHHHNERLNCYTVSNAASPQEILRTVADLLDHNGAAFLSMTGPYILDDLTYEATIIVSTLYS